MLVRMVSYFMIMVVISAISVAIGVFSYLQPMEEGKKKVDDEIAELNKKKKSGQKVKEEIKEFKEKINMAKREIVTLLKEKTKDRDIGKFLNDIEVDAQDSGITLRNIRIHPKTNKARYTEIPMEFNFEGAYFELYDFLTRVEKRGMLNFSDSRLNLSGGGADKGKTIKELASQTTTRNDLKDINGKDIKLKPYENAVEFPKMKVTLDGTRIIIIDGSHITKYETNQS